MKKAIDRALDPIKAKAGRWWSTTTLAPFVAAETAAISLFGHNPALLKDVLVAPGVSLFAAVGLGSLAVAFDRSPDYVRYFVPAAAVGLGIVAAVGAQHNLAFEGIQDGIAAIPTGEAVVIAGGATAAGITGAQFAKALIDPVRPPVHPAA